MAKKRRKKYPKLPNGYGSISYLGSGRRNPYAVYPPASEYYASTGQMKHPKALCYVSDWNVGFAVLTAYKAGTYVEGMEKELNEMSLDGTNVSDLAQKLLADYNLVTRAEKQVQNDCPTFAEAYKQFTDWKFNGKKKYSASTINAAETAFKNFSALHDRKVNEITGSELQNVLDSSNLKHASVELMCTHLKQFFKFALAENIIETNPTLLLKVGIEEDDEHGVPYSEKELKILWDNKENEFVEVILIMCYSGYRIGELEVIEVDLKKKCFVGGLKTKSSKERIVPIHSSILPIVKRRMKKYGKLATMQQQTFRNKSYPVLEQLKIVKHTPHDCRHTFSMLCEKYNVNENDRKRLMGHSFGNDITNGIYGHRSLEELRIEIEKIIKS